MEKYRQICEQAARAGGQVLIDWFDRVQATEKGPRDLVTQADTAAQERIRTLIAEEFPDHTFVGEEGGRSELDQGNRDSEYCWVVDPLDGTTNYVHRLPFFAVSVALRRDDRPIVGVVYAPQMGECFCAMEGQGATLNGEAIRPSGCCVLDKALVAASFPARVTRDGEEVRRFLEVLDRCRAVRRMGSAALNLCYVACGRLDAYWATSLQQWDVAAGGLILTQAGGSLTHVDGGPWSLDDPRIIAAATSELGRQLGRVLTLK